MAQALYLIVDGGIFFYIGIGMGYVAKAYTAIDTEIYIDVRGRKLKAKVVKAPFRK